MQQEKHYRHELKYSISYSEYLAMRGRLGMVMERDPHTNEAGLYQIRSIYFDNADDKALREKVDGVNRREKFRIRYYNGDPSAVIRIASLNAYARISGASRMLPRIWHAHASISPGMAGMSWIRIFLRPTMKPVWRNGLPATAVYTGR